MTSLLHLFIIIPFIGFIISLLIPGKEETWLSRTAFFTVGIHLLSILVFVAAWLLNGHATLNLKDIVLFQTTGYEFFIDFCFDKITVVYLCVGAFLTFLVTIYSRYYLHREEGYKRFFNTILLFYIGYNIVVLSGNFETLFLGWEILGISSFLLISFYRHRYLPVKNALKVFSIYRIGDIGLILAMWMSHHLWHENITFLKLSNAELVHEHLQGHSTVGIFISLMILLSATAKSAQLPFSSWLPRAMEGPTPSSAIFYGSLSVHIGVFLLLRTFPFWENQYSIRVLIIIIGVLTSIITTGIARVQSSVKSQIAYSSAAQIGLIFIEVALGFEKLALFHFAGNAFLRTYQLLVSPSVVSYLIKEQFYNFTPHPETLEDSLPKKIENTFYLLSLKEWNLDGLMHRFLWSPIKMLGQKFNLLTTKRVIYFFIPTYLIGMACKYWESSFSNPVENFLPFLFSFIGLVMVLKSFSERKSPQMSWLLIIMNHLWIALAVSFNEHFGFGDIVWYLSGVVIAGSIGSACLYRLNSFEKNISLNSFQGHAYEYPRMALVFLLSCLALTGFPITPTFIGEDIVFSHIHEDQFMLAFFVSLSFIVDGLALIRIYARIFLGPNAKVTQDMAHRSS